MMIKFVLSEIKFRSWLIAVSIFFLSACSSDSPEEKPVFYDYQSFDIYPFLNLDYSKQRTEQQTISKFVESVAQRQHVYYRHYKVSDPFSVSEKFLEQGYRIRENEPLYLDQPVDWGKINNGDTNFTFQKNALYQYEPLLQYYVDTSDDRYMQIVLFGINDWQSYHQKAENSHKFQWYDMSTGLRAIKIGTVLEWLIDSGAKEESWLPLIKMADEHLRYLSDPEYLGKGNHLLFQMNGIVSLCKQFPELKRCQQALPYAEEHFKQEFLQTFFSDGMHSEHSPEYHVYMLEQLQALDATGWYDQIAGNVLTDAAANTVFLFHPNKEVALIGDTSELSMSRFNLHPNVEYVLSGGLRGEIPEKSSASFAESGYAILRSDWREKPLSEHSYLIMQAGHHSNIHKHSDDLSFSWSELGGQILIDSGKYSYREDEYTPYFKSVSAHNTVQIDEEMLQIDNRSPYGSGIKAVVASNELKAGVIDASVKYIRTDTQHERKLFLQEKQWLAIVDDLNSSDTARRFTQWFHLTPSAELVSQQSGSFVFYLPVQNKYLHIVEITSEASESTLIKGQDKPYVQGWMSRKYDEKIPNFAVSFNKHGKVARFVTLFILSDSSALDITSHIDITEQKYQICWSSDQEMQGIMLQIPDNQIVACR